MDKIYTDFEEVKKSFPDEWIVLGNPKMKDTSILGGVVLYHSKGKKRFVI